MMPSFIIKKWGEMMKTQTLTEEGLSIYDQEMKDYIKNRGSGVTMEELIPLLDEKSNIGHTHTQSEIGLDQVENKSSETIRNEITEENITTALGYTPYTPTEVDNKIDDLDSCIITNDDIDSIFSENS